MNTRLYTVFLLAALFMQSCHKDVTDSSSTPTTGSIGIKLYDFSGGLGHPFEVSPIRVYLNNTLKGTIGNSTTTDCSGLQVDCLIQDLAPGSYNLDFVLPNNKYLQAQGTVLAGDCAKVQLSLDQFYNGNVNYGTSQGSISFQTDRVLSGTINIYIDNNYAGQINGFAIYDLCGFNWGTQNISIPVSPGTHAYHAEDATYGVVWNNNAVSVQSNQCFQVTLH